ncbi:MAG: PEP-CTERM sorting domain-containing protein [Acidobacteriia bacterium]|nr:PEP-CTERM sorting domain-containing protein [Terriglobia bacterium]
MKGLTLRSVVVLFALCFCMIGVASADTTEITVNFPSDNTFYCSATNGCGFMGGNGGLSQPMWTVGDTVTETFFTGQPFVNDLTANWGVVNGYGGSPGTFYENDVYINGILVAAFVLGDCNYCDTLLTVGGTVNFANIYGGGVYNLSIVLAQTAGQNLGSEWFSTTTAAGGPSTNIFSTEVPEPSSLALFGSGILGIAGVVRRKLGL